MAMFLTAAVLHYHIFYFELLLTQMYLNANKYHNHEVFVASHFEEELIVADGTFSFTYFLHRS